VQQSRADPIMLQIATTMAAVGGLNVLATLVKPLDGDALKYAFQWLH